MSRSVCKDAAASIVGPETSVAFDEALTRVKAEFLEMPGLHLTEAQAVRLWCFEATLCRAVLSALVESRFLVRTRHSTFARA